MHFHLHQSTSDGPTLDKGKLRRNARRLLLPFLATLSLPSLRPSCCSRRRYLTFAKAVYWVVAAVRRLADDAADVHVDDSIHCSRLYGCLLLREEAEKSARDRDQGTVGACVSKKSPARSSSYIAILARTT